MKSEPIELFATLLQLGVFLAIILLMSEALFDGGIFEEVRHFVVNLGIV